MTLNFPRTDALGGFRTDGLTAPERVYTDLRRRILNLDLVPGATLARNDLAAHYQVSLTPVREALKELEQDGLVLVFPQSRTMVAPIDMRQLHESHFLRVAVETEVVRRLCERPDDEMINRAEGILKMQAALVGDLSQMEVFTELDRAFHRTLFDAVNMQSVSTLVTRRLGHLARCQRLELPMEGKAETIIAAHRAILDGIRNRDASAAMDAVRAHLTGTILRVETLRKAYPTYFGDPVPDASAPPETTR